MTDPRIERGAHAYEQIVGPVMGFPEGLDKKAERRHTWLRTVLIPAILYAADNITPGEEIK